MISLKIYLCASLFIIGALVYVLLETQSPPVAVSVAPVAPYKASYEPKPPPVYNGKVVYIPPPEPEPEPLPHIDTSVLDEITQKYGNSYAMYYENIESGYVYRRNADKIYQAASVIKAPYCLYVYKLAESGATLSSAIYTNEDYKEGSGVIKDMDVGTVFTEKSLLTYAIRNSDNIALAILVKKYGTAGFKEFMADIGNNPDYITTVAGALTNADELGRIAKEIYKYIEKDGREYAEIFKNDLMSTRNPLIISKYKMARKYGWWEEALHDMAIVYAPSPYILVIMSESGYNVNYTAFKEISAAFEEFNDEVLRPLS